MTTARVSFIVPVRNDAERLARCLASIRANRYPADAIELLVADNGSTDESAAVARAAGARVLTLPRLRVGELRNRAAAMAQSEILAFVDADNEIVPEWISAAVSSLGEERVVAVGAPYSPPTPGTWVQRLYDRLRRHPQGREPVEWLGSGNLAVRREAFEAVGGFDTSLETCEDVDLCRKLTAAGGTLLADQRLRNVHYGDPSTLTHVFFGELWRGRDNVRVSLRAPRSWRTLASAAIPVAVLAAIVATVAGAFAGVLSASRIGMGLAALAALGLITLVGSRAARMTSGHTADWPGALAVAAAYELGRAFALTTRVPHARRRAGARA
jgi:glycosyltransferase involved in cell wall biosynthesis